MQVTTTTTYIPSQANTDFAQESSQGNVGLGLKIVLIVVVIILIIVLFIIYWHNKRNNIKEKNTIVEGKEGFKTKKPKMGKEKPKSGRVVTDNAEAVVATGSKVKSSAGVTGQTMTSSTELQTTPSNTRKTKSLSPQKSPRPVSGNKASSV